MKVNKTARFEMKATPETKAKIEAEAKKLGISKSALITMLFNQFLMNQSK